MGGAGGGEHLVDDGDFATPSPRSRWRSAVPWAAVRSPRVVSMAEAASCHNSAGRGGQGLEVTGGYRGVPVEHGGAQSGPNGC